MITGDSSILKERCLNGLRETYQSLGISGNSVANAIQKLKDQTVILIREIYNTDADYEPLISELIDYFDLAATEVMELYFYSQFREIDIQEAIQEYLVASSLGLDISKTKLHRFIPSQIYLPIIDQSQITKLFEAIDKFFIVFDFTVVYEYSAEIGSFFKRFFVGTKETLSQPEVKERLSKVERAVELQYLHKVQSEVDKNQAEAVAKLMEALNKVEEGGVLFIGSVLIVKRKDSPVIAYTLTPEQLIYLQQNPRLASDPAKLIETLSSPLIYSNTQTSLPRTLEHLD